MKKLLLLFAAFLMATSALNDVQAQTRIAKNHMIDMGIHFGFGDFPLGSFGGLNLDINSTTSNFRVRVDLDLLQSKIRYKNSPYVFGAAVDAQYLFALSKEDLDGFYLYPSLGFGCEHHKNSPVWGEKDWGLGINIGGGAEYQFADRWALFFEASYQIRFKNENHFAPMIGFSFAF